MKTVFICSTAILLLATNFHDAQARSPRKCWPKYGEPSASCLRAQAEDQREIEEEWARILGGSSRSSNTFFSLGSNGNAAITPEYLDSLGIYSNEQIDRIISGLEMQQNGQSIDTETQSLLNQLNDSIQ